MLSSFTQQLAITTSNLVASSSSENIRSASLLTSKEDNATMALLNKMTILQGQILAFEQEKLERELEHKAKELELKKQRSDREFEMWERDFQLRKEEFEWRKQNAIRDPQFPASTSIKTIAPPPQPTESLPVAVPRDIPLQIDFQVSLPQNQLEEKPKKIFISYSWHNSRTEKLKEGLAEEELANVGIWDPRVHSRNLIKSLGYDPWLDVEQLEVGKKLEGQLADVLSDEVSMVLVHASDEYAASTNCKKEFEFAMDLGLKILPIVVGPEPSNDQNGKPKQTSGSKTKPWSKGWLGFSINHVLYVDARREQQLQAATQAIGEAIAKEMKSLYQTTEKMSAENIKTIRDAILSGNENLLADLVRKHSEDVNADVEGSPSILELCTTKASLASIKLLVEAGLKLTHQGVAPLNLAVKRGDVAILECLLDLGAEVNRLDDNGSSALHIAAAFASPTEINILVNHGANLEIKNSQGSTPLLVACSALKLDNMKALKEFGANVNAENSSGENALHLVCKIDGADIEIVKYLLDSNVSVVKGDDDNWYPADRAAEKNRVDIIQEMFKTANVADECYVLHSAAEAGSLDVVRYLTSKECPNKVDLFEEDGSGWTPIDAAVRNGRLEVVKYLVELDKSVLKERPKHLKSLMFVAAEENEPEVLKYLLTEAKVHYDIEETDDDGWTALHYMIWKGGYECIDILLKKDPHLLTLVTENGRSVIGWAAFYGRLQLVETIIKVDHDVKEKIWRKDDNGNNVFHLALWSKNFEVVKVIGELDDTIVASKTKSGINALQIAAKIGSIEIFKYLLEHPKGAFDIHEVDSEGYSLLAKAILSNNLEMVKLVTELDPTLASFKTGKNECMVSVAARASSLDILKYLLAIPDVSFNLKEVDDDGNNIFMNAIASNNTFVLSHLVSLDSTLLLSRGAKDMSPPCYAAYCNAFESFKFLVNQPTHQYDLAETNEKNWSAMTFAVANACLEIVEILHSKSDGLINIKSAGNKNLLHVLLDQVSDKVEGDDTSTKESPNDENTLECLKFLVDKGSFNLSDVSDEGFTPLAYAIQSGYTDCVKFLVKKDPTTLQIKPYDGSTLLHLCFYDDDYDDCLDFLLENYKDYFDLSARNAEECTVLEAAVVNNAVECVKYLADFDSSLLEVRPFGLTLMEFAAAQRGTDVFSFLLDYASASSSESDDDDEADEDGEDGEDDEDDEDDEENDNSEDENEVEDSADDEANDEDEKSSKSGKKNGGTAEKAKAKVDNDTEESKAEESASNKLTDPRDMSDEELVSLLTFACLGGSEVIAKKLLLNFKKLSKRINVKKTPASERPKFSEKSQLIFDVLCTLRNDQAAQRALSFGYALGAWNHNVDLLNSLKFLNVPFDPTVEWLGGNPFYYYSDEVYEILYSLEPTYTLASAKLNQSVFYSMVGEHEGLLKWAKYVLAHGADPNLQLNQSAIFPERAGFTALHRACQTGRVDALEFLFTVEQVDFKVTDCEGSTPLHILAANPYWDNKIINSLVKRFLEHGAVINAVNNAGCTALDVAEKTRTAYGRKQQNRMEMCLRMYGGRPAASL
ncbi:Ankyrin repeat and death domain-containing protein 1A [Entophlyctis sp. JEL0112]|nr:Ankyrin repeat and death domain-containing protein 1A [Entophlyctis sp. JEL0112]